MAKVITTELQHSGASGANITLDSSKNVTCENNLTVDGTSTLSGNVAVTGNVTVTGTLPADKLTGTLPAISGASLTNLPSSPPAFRNMVDNGKMDVAQRSTSVTGKSSNGYYVCDRYRNVFESVGTYSVSRVEDAPEGFVYSMKIDCTTASGTLGASSRHYIEYRNESWNQQHLLYGTSNAKTTTLSFWVKCTKTGTFNVNLLNEGARTGSVSGTEVADKTIGKLVTISAANTWEKKTLTYVGDTAAFIRNNRHKGVGIRFILNAGSSYSGGTIQSTWATGNNASYYTGNLALGVSTDDDFYITGIQWETGDSATDFEHRTFGDTLQQCSRYFQVFAQGESAMFSSRGNSGSTAMFSIPLTTPLRNTPTLYWASTYYYNYTAKDSTSDDPSIIDWHEHYTQVGMQAGSISNVADDRTATIFCFGGDSNTPSYDGYFDAEF